MNIDIHQVTSISFDNIRQIGSDTYPSYCRTIVITDADGKTVEICLYTNNDDASALKVQA